VRDDLPSVLVVEMVSEDGQREGVVLALSVHCRAKGGEGKGPERVTLVLWCGVLHGRHDCSTRLAWSYCDGDVKRFSHAEGGSDAALCMKACMPVMHAT
jgi:hypothetical protein